MLGKCFFATVSVKLELDTWKLEIYLDYAEYWGQETYLSKKFRKYGNNVRVKLKRKDQSDTFRVWRIITLLMHVITLPMRAKCFGPAMVKVYISNEVCSNIFNKLFHTNHLNDNPGWSRKLCSSYTKTKRKMLLFWPAILKWGRFNIILFYYIIIIIINQPFNNFHNRAV